MVLDGFTGSQLPELGQRVELSYSRNMGNVGTIIKGSLALTATNPFNEYVKQKLDINGPGFTTTTIRKIPFRSIGINFTWKFGKLEFKNEHKDEGGDLNL